MLPLGTPNGTTPRLRTPIPTSSQGGGNQTPSNPLPTVRFSPNHTHITMERTPQQSASALGNRQAIRISNRDLPQLEAENHPVMPLINQAYAQQAAQFFDQAANNFDQESAQPLLNRLDEIDRQAHYGQPNSLFPNSFAGQTFEQLLYTFDQTTQRLQNDPLFAPFLPRSEEDPIALSSAVPLETAPSIHGNGEMRHFNSYNSFVSTTSHTAYRPTLRRRNDIPPLGRSVRTPSPTVHKPRHFFANIKNGYFSTNHTEKISSSF